VRAPDPARTAAPVRICRRQLRNLVGAAIALQHGRQARDVAPILARQAGQALAARQAVASVAGAGDSAGSPFRSVAGDNHFLTDDHLRLLERAERGAVTGVESFVDPVSRSVVAAAASISDRDGRPIGALMVADGYSGAFGEDDIAVLVGLAHIASLTLDNVRLHESVRAGEANRSCAMGQPAPAASELTDLLTVILGHAGLLNAAFPETDERRNDIAAIVTAAGRASRISSQLLARGQD
jgi:hypothetical protein